MHRCEKGPKFEAWFYQREQDSERYNIREAVVYQMTKMCKVAGPPSSRPTPSPQPPDLNNSRWDCGAGASFTVVGCQKHAGQDDCVVRLEQDGKILLESPKPLNEIQSHVQACKALPRSTLHIWPSFPILIEWSRACSPASPRRM